MNQLELGCQGFHEVPPSLPHITPTLIFKIKALTPFEWKYQIVQATLLVFVNIGDDSIMADDVVTFLNPLVVPIEKEEFEKAPLDVNVSQWLHEEKSSRRVVLAWDHWLSLNPHALTIYLKFVLGRGVAQERFEECECEDDDIRLHCWTWSKLI